MWFFLFHLRYGRALFAGLFGRFLHAAFCGLLLVLLVFRGMLSSLLRPQGNACRFLRKFQALEDEW